MNKMAIIESCRGRTTEARATIKDLHVCILGKLELAFDMMRMVLKSKMSLSQAPHCPPKVPSIDASGTHEINEHQRVQNQFMVIVFLMHHNTKIYQIEESH